MPTNKALNSCVNMQTQDADELIGSIFYHTGHVPMPTRRANRNAFVH